MSTYDAATDAADTTDSRRLVSVETISAITDIPGADSIETAQIKGWTVVVQKDQFLPGDPVVYIEVDAALPLDDARFEFLGARSTKQVDGRSVHILATAKLRGVYSQGIAFPLADFPEVQSRVPSMGDNLDLILGITKYEPPLPEGVKAVAPFPAFLRKTAAERVQNLTPSTWDIIQADAHNWVPVEKADGDSLTAWKSADGALRIAGRKWELDTTTGSAYNVAADQAHLADLLAPGQWVQGEVVGPGLHGNPLAVDEVRLVVFGFGTFDTDTPSLATTRRVPRSQWPDALAAMAAPAYDFALPATITETVNQVEKVKSLITPGKAAEGVVWTHREGLGLPALDGRHVFKSLSAKYLLRNGG